MKLGTSKTDGLTRRRGAIWTAAAGCVVVLLAYAVRQSDPDLWGHVYYGKLWLTVGIVETDPYSYTSGGIPWIGHEIGAEIVSQLAYSWGGQAGLCLLKTAVGLLVGLILWWTLPRNLRRSWLGLSVWVLAMHMVSLYLLVRPQLFTYVCTAMCGTILYRNLQRPTPAVWLLPLIGAFWTNFHGGYVVLLGLVGLYFAGPLGHWLAARLRGEGSERFPRPGWTLLGVLVASGLFTFLNPYGPRAWVFLHKALTNPYTKQIIDEWRGIQWLNPVRQEMLYMMMALGVIVAAGAGISFRSLLRGDPRRRADATGLLVCLVTGFLAIDSYRHIPLFAILSAPWLLRWGGRAWRRMAGVNPARAKMFAPVIILAVIVPVVPTLWEIVRDPRPRLAHLKPMPVGAVRYIQEHHLSGNIYCAFGWGQYLIAHLYPQCRVGMDGRYDTAYPEEEFVANFAFIIEGNTDRAVETPTDFVLTAGHSPAHTSMSRCGDWYAMHEDEVATLWARVGETYDKPRYRIKPTHEPVSARYFP